MKFGVVYKEENKKAQELAKKAIDFLKKNGHQVFGEKKLKESEIILTFGGDGTLIHTACKFAPLNIPFVGFNTGNLGFLTAAEANDWQSALEKLISSDFFISKRMTIEASVKTNPKFRSVNEVAIKGLYRVINLQIEVNGEKFLRTLGDGVIVSTQTGSTAYSLSAGGPIVDPDLDCLLVTPVNPIGLPIPSAVLSPDDEIKVEIIRGDDVSLIVDGQVHTKLIEGQKVKIKRGQHYIKLGYFDQNQFLKSLNAKFGLASRIVG